MERANVEKLRKEYPVGTVVILEKMEDMQAPPVGTRGKVTGVDDIGTIHVTWETGSTLGVCLGEDSVTKVFVPNVNVEDIYDSMEMESGTVICEYTDGEYETHISVQGEVKVSLWGEYYTHPSEFPEALKKAIRENPGTWDTYPVPSPSGDLSEEECVPYICDNNWFEIFVYKNDSCIGFDVVDIERSTAEELYELCKDFTEKQKEEDKRYFQNVYNAVLEYILMNDERAEAFTGLTPADGSDGSYMEFRKAAREEAVRLLEKYDISMLNRFVMDVIVEEGASLIFGGWKTKDGEEVPAA